MGTPRADSPHTLEEDVSVPLVEVNFRFSCHLHDSVCGLNGVSFACQSYSFPPFRSERIWTHHVKRPATVDHARSTIRLHSLAWLGRVLISSVCKCCWLEEVDVTRLFVFSFLFVLAFVRVLCCCSSTLFPCALSNLKPSASTWESEGCISYLLPFLDDTAQRIFPIALRLVDVCVRELNYSIFLLVVFDISHNLLVTTFEQHEN